MADGRDLRAHSRVWVVACGDGDRLLLPVLAALPPDVQLLRQRGDRSFEGAEGGSRTTPRPVGKPPFLVTDNGSWLIARRFGHYVDGLFAHIWIQYRTPRQLGQLERFHQALKDEEVYWRLYDDPRDARRCLAEFRERYNHRRPHWASVPERGGDPVAPHNVYVRGVHVGIAKWQG